MQRIRGYKYRAYPNKKQKEFFEKTFGCCRFVFNYYLYANKKKRAGCQGTLKYSEASRDLSANLKKTKKWHPIVFIGFSALVGIIFQMG